MTGPHRFTPRQTSRTCLAVERVSNTGATSWRAALMLEGGVSALVSAGTVRSCPAPGTEGGRGRLLQLLWHCSNTAELGVSYPVAGACLVHIACHGDGTGRHG